MFSSLLQVFIYFFYKWNGLVHHLKYRFPLVFFRQVFFRANCEFAYDLSLKLSNICHRQRAKKVARSHSTERDSIDLSLESHSGARRDPPPPPPFVCQAGLFWLMRWWLLTPWWLVAWAKRRRSPNGSTLRSRSNCGGTNGTPGGSWSCFCWVSIITHS